MNSPDSAAAEGRAWKFGDNVNTDDIMPAKYLNISNGEVLAQHCMEGLDETFAKKVQEGDVIVAGRNFGCGSSREHAPLCIRAAGISCVIGATFARIFFRNAINIGLPVLECAEAAQKIQEGDTLRVDIAAGFIEDVTRGESYRAAPLPEFMREIIRAGGLMNWAMAHMDGDTA
ncbi:MAG: 3-isopropylmalate dehydratase small subunit [Candidatus Hydrogenedentes bacterium]|nr:3-isopropylmalate dehydratase small subunit [Candidatus Hydrogenedentota bacterium]